jgi:hypothetical protein
VGKAKPQVTPEAFEYFRSYIEEKNIVRQFTLGASRQVPDDLDFIPFNRNFSWLFFYFLGCGHDHKFISCDDYTCLHPEKKALLCRL